MQRILEKESLEKWTRRVPCILMPFSRFIFSSAAQDRKEDRKDGIF